MSSIDFKKKIAFDVISALEDIKKLSKIYPEVAKCDFYKRAYFKLQLLKDEDNTYLLSKYYEQI